MVPERRNPAAGSGRSPFDSAGVDRLVVGVEAGFLKEPRKREQRRDTDVPNGRDVGRIESDRGDGCLQKIPSLVARQQRFAESSFASAKPTLFISNAQYRWVFQKNGRPPSPQDTCSGQGGPAAFSIRSMSALSALEDSFLIGRFASVMWGSILASHAQREINEVV